MDGGVYDVTEFLDDVSYSTIFLDAPLPYHLTRLSNSYSIPVVARSWSDREEK